MKNFIFKDRDGQTPLPQDLRRGLKTKNVQTMVELDELEEQNIAEGLIWLDDSNEECFDYIFWCKLHKKLFGDVWQWAGEVRSHELDNPDFLPSQQIRTELMELIGNVQYWFEHKTYSNQEIIARLHERLLTIHPFTNGNGRWARILTEHICKAYKIQNPTWNLRFKDDFQRRRSDYIESIKEARYKKDFKPLINTIFS